MMNRNAEVESKLSQLRAYMADAGLDCVILGRHGNHAWLGAGGRTAVYWGTQAGVAWLVVTPKDAVLVTDNIEGGRLVAEEFAGVPWRLAIFSWWESPVELLKAQIPAGARVGVDGPVPGVENARDILGEIVGLRATLDPGGQMRARQHGRQVGAVMAEVARTVVPGMTEHEIAGRIGGGLTSLGFDVPVLIIGTDERFFTWRHFIPTDKQFEKYGCFVVCARKDGIVCSATRLVHFGTPSDDVVRKVAAVQKIDAEVIAATRPGKTAGELFEVIRGAYKATGFDDEWQNHHQGGLAGFDPREVIATPGNPQRVELGQLYAWNPSVAGAKSEDTVLVGSAANEVVTDDGTFPCVDVTTSGGVVVRRPSLLVR